MPLLNNAQTLSSTLFIITFDESDTKGNNQIFTAALGAGIKRGTNVSQRFAGTFSSRVEFRFIAKAAISKKHCGSLEIKVISVHKK